MFLESLRGTVRRVRRLRQPAESTAESDEDPSHRSSESIPADSPGPLDAKRARALLASDSVADHRRAVEWLIGIPELSRTEADAFVSTFRRTIAEGDPTRRHLATRGLRAVHSHHPEAVVPTVGELVEGLSAFNLVVRRETVRTLTAILQSDPGRSGAVYASLGGHSPGPREAAFRVLVEVAETVPAVLQPISPAIRREIAAAEIDRTLLARAVEHLAAEDPHVDLELVELLLDWLPARDPAVEAAVLQAVIQRPAWPESIAEEALAHLLSGLAAGGLDDSRAGARWVLATLETHPDLVETVRRWGTDRPGPERRRVAVRLDEAAGSVDPSVLAALSLEDDPFYSLLDPSRG